VHQHERTAEDLEEIFEDIRLGIIALLRTFCELCPMSPSRLRKGATTQSHFKPHSGTGSLRVSKSPPPSDLSLRAASDTVGSWFDASAMYHTCASWLGHAGDARKKCLAHAVPCQRSLVIWMSLAHMVLLCRRRWCPLAALLSGYLENHAALAGPGLCDGELDVVARTGPSINTRLSTRVPQ
jgi:hypothetical protein